MVQKSMASDALGAVAHMKKSGMLKILTAVLIVGALLLIIGSIALPSDKENDGGDASEDIATGRLDFYEYKKDLEEEIESLCGTVSGVGYVNAVTFFDEIGGSIYAQNTQSGGAQDKAEYVIIGSGSSSHALYIGESLPKLSGIGLVCNTGGDISKRNELVALLSAAYGLPMSRIYVTESGK
ncbi:MAG: hypothetical protein E7649_06850 [Ruminococcaceae bacterium]|nr:hypothetical protein [Oscillospiraceae bacterium]